MKATGNLLREVEAAMVAEAYRDRDRAASVADYAAVAVAVLSKAPGRWALQHCRLTGHVPVWLDDDVPSADYKCARCWNRIYFWSGKRTGWYLEEEHVEGNPAPTEGVA